MLPERLSTTAWAVRYRELPETGGTRGRYRIETVPYHRRPQDLMGDPTIPLVVLAWASQTGKSTCIENAIGRKIHLQPGPLLMVRPKIDDAEGWAKERFDPMVRATPVLRDRVRLSRGTSTLRFKTFPGGYLFIPAATSATELASRSAPDLFVDEADRMEDIAGEGNPIEIVQRRNAATDLGTTVITSTPRDADSTMIWPYLEGGTFELYEVPCPHCGHQQPLAWGAQSEGGLKWSWGSPRTAQYLCRACLTLIDEREKPAMLLAGDWVATQPDREYPSFHLNGLYSPFAKSNWAQLAREWEKAQLKPSDLQVFVNTRLAETFDGDREKVRPDDVAGRLGVPDDWTEGAVPAGVGLLTLGADVQDDWIEVSVWGWGADLESWLIWHEQLPGDPSRAPESPGSVWQALDAVTRKVFVHVHGQSVGVHGGFVDSGHQTQNVYAFTRARVNRRLFACKGGPAASPAISRPTMQTKHRVALYTVGVDHFKTELLRSQIHETQPGPGYVHLPTWSTSAFLAGLVSEERKSRLVKGRVVREWVKRRGQERNEPLDCRNYARGYLESLGPQLVRALGRMAEQLATPAAATPATDGTDTPQPPAPWRPASRSNWVQGSWYKRR